MAVEYMMYKGEELPIQVGYYALKNMQKHTKGKGLSQLDEDLSLYEPLLYYSLKMGYISEHGDAKGFPWKMTDMEFILEECLFTEFSDIVARAFTPDTEELGKLKAVGGQSMEEIQK